MKPPKEAREFQQANRRFTIAHQFAIRDSTTVRDPLVGWLWEINRVGIRPYQDWLKETQGKNPLVNELARAQAKVGVYEALGKGKKGEAAFDRALDNALANVGISDLEVENTAEGVAQYLVKRIWSDENSLQPYGVLENRCQCGENVGFAGEPCAVCGSTSFKTEVVELAYEPSHAKEIFAIDTPMSSAEVAQVHPPESGAVARESTLGPVLLAWVMRETEKTERFRQGHLEDGVKNSAAPSAGD